VTQKKFSPVTANSPISSSIHRYHNNKKCFGALNYGNDVIANMGACNDQRSIFFLLEIKSYAIIGWLG
jgi:hypothetical protein